MQRHLLFKLSAILSLASAFQIYLNSQTCSCAATPLSSTPEYSTLNNKKWHFELTYKYHALNDLIEGTEEVRDDTNRRRVAHFLLLDTRYALTRSFTLRAVFSLVRQEREVGISSALPVHTQGVGDSMLTAQFSPIQYSENNQTEFSFGGGIKLPIGKADAEIVGIAALTNPPSIPLQQATYLEDDDLVIGIQVGNTIRAYSHPILDQHEIANDGIGNTFFAMTYCPLTGSALAWDTSNFSGDKTFGVSGLLYNSNLIPYDRQSDSNWSQMLLLCVNGSRLAEEAKAIYAVETTWETWKKLYPKSTVLSDNTGHSRNYDVYPYGDYKTSDNLLFSVSNQDSRLHKKERVHGVMVGDKTKVYPIDSFDESIEVMNETFNGLQLVVAGSADLNFAVSFERKLPDGTLLDFDPVEGELPVIMMDNEGTKWDIFGNSVSGPRLGSRLTRTRSFISYWFAWIAFYPGAKIHGFPTTFGTSDVMSDGEITQINRSFRRKEFVRSEVGRRILKEWPMIIRGTQLVPHYFDGKIDGLQIALLPENSVLSEVGISRGDVIKEVNGVKLNNVAQLISLWDKFRNNNRFEVNFERNGQSLYFLYILR